jgi:hypothetical protein
MVIMEEVGRGGGCEAFNFAAHADAIIQFNSRVTARKFFLIHEPSRNSVAEARASSHVGQRFTAEFLSARIIDRPALFMSLFILLIFFQDARPNARRVAGRDGGKEGPDRANTAKL